MEAYKRVAAARAKGRPTGSDFIEHIFEGFVELHGDRRFAQPFGKRLGGFVGFVGSGGAADDLDEGHAGHGIEEMQAHHLVGASHGGGHGGDAQAGRIGGEDAAGGNDAVQLRENGTLDVQILHGGLDDHVGLGGILHVQRADDAGEGRIAVFGDEDVHAARAAYGRCGIQRKSPADQLLEMDGDAFRFVFAAQPPEVLRPLDECQHLLARSHKKVRPLVLNAPNRSPGSAYSSCLPRLSKKRVSTMPTLWSATMCSHVL